MLGHAGTFGSAGTFLVCTDIFGHVQVLLGLRGYFCTHTGTFGLAWVLWVHAGTFGLAWVLWVYASTFGHKGTFRHARVLLGAHGCFWAWGAIFGHLQVLLGTHGYFWARGYFLACFGNFGHTRLLFGM